MCHVYTYIYLFAYVILCIISLEHYHMLDIVHYVCYLMVAVGSYCYLRLLRASKRTSRCKKRAREGHGDPA